MEKENVINCPECGAKINVNEVLYQQLEEQIKTDFEKKASKKEKEFQHKLQELEEEKEKVQKEKEHLKELVDKEVQNKVRLEKTKWEKSIREQILDETSEQFKELKKELEQKSNQVKELNKTKADLEKLRREKDELCELINLEKEKEFSEKLKDERLKIKKQSEEENFFKIKERDKVIEDLKVQMEDMKRKAEQGSIQLQGEIQELELQNLLNALYPFDEIAEIKKGQRGADVVQIVRTNQGVDCGKIYYESKRTKNYDDNWLQKLRDDNLEVKADVLVLVTEAMPERIDKFFHKDGVWICTFSDVKGLSMVLRHSILQLHTIAITHQGKETKMEMLYNYLTSQEFRGQFEAILEGYKTLQDGHNDEKLRMQKIWKEREKQLEKILSNTVGFYGAIKGIAGSSIPHVKMLEDGNELTE